MTDEQKQKLSEAAKAAWLRPEVRQRRREAANRPEAKEKKHNSMKSAWTNPEYRERRLQSNKAAWDRRRSERRDRIRQGISERAKKTWERPEVRQRRCEAINRPEVRERKREASKLRMCPELMRKLVEGSSRPQVIEKRRESLKQAWERPEVRQKRREAASRPEAKERKHNSMKAAWDRSEYRDKLSGPNAHNWLGGKSFEPYTLEWTRRLKHRIRERDHFTCKICGAIWHPEKRLFPVHHIDYNKNNCEENNLITLCKKCHSKTNAHRDYWMQYFQALMSKGQTAQADESSEGETELVLKVAQVECAECDLSIV